MFLKRKHFPILLPFLCAAIGTSVGICLVLLNPPQHPDDRWLAFAIATGGLGVLGMLSGYLYSLWFRGHIGVMEIVAVAGILVGVFGWLLNGKSGRGNIANVFGIVFWAAALTFVIRAVALVGNRKPNARDR